MEWTRQDLVYSRIRGMDPRAEWLLGPGFADFMPPAFDALIPILLRSEDRKVVEELARERRDGRSPGPPILILGFGEQAGLAAGALRGFTTKEFFDELARPDSDYALVQGAAKQIQISLPLRSQSLPAWKPGGKMAPLTPPPVGPPKGGWPPGAVVMGVIDDGIAFAHARFRAPDGTTRVQCAWRQDGLFDPVSSTVPFGREIWKNDLSLQRKGIDRLLSECRHAGSVDEEEVYRRAGLIDFVQPDHKAAAWRAAHGTFVLDLAAGSDPAAAPANRPIVAVQLPVAATADQSGAGLEHFVVQGIDYILDRARRLAGNGPPLPVVINFSYGTIAGPHDGTGVMEATIDDAIAAASPPVTVVLPSGNAHLSRCHAEIAFRNNAETADLSWRVQPDGLTSSTMEIWLPYDANPKAGASRVGLSIVTPDGQESPIVEEWSSWGVALIEGGTVLCEAHYAFSPAPTDRGVFVITLQPTARLRPSVPALAPSGMWTIRLHNRQLSSVEPVEAWIERNDLLYGYPRRGRQSYFDQACYRRYDAQGRIVEEDASPPNCSVRRAGLLNGIGTGAHAVVAGGFRRDSLAMAEYSAGGPITPARGGAADPCQRKPDAVLTADDSKVQAGVLAAGSRSGSFVAMNGTSVAAPQLAKAIADEVAAGRPGDRAAVKALAQASEAALPGWKPVLPIERGGWGRIETPRRRR